MGVKNNEVILSGMCKGPFVYDHKAYGKFFYSQILHIERDSGKVDSVCMIAPETLVYKDIDYTGKKIKVTGEFRSYHYAKDAKHHMQLFLHVNKIEILTDSTEKDENSITLYGYIVKKPVLRKTPLGRTIVDSIVAAHRTNGPVSDYIPCIFWEKYAAEIANAEVGTPIWINGRVQSREYRKIGAEDSIRIAYEVSVFECELLKREGRRDEKNRSEKDLSE